MTLAFGAAARAAHRGSSPDARDRISGAIETACSGWSGPRLRPLGATTRPWTVDAAALNLAEREPMHTRSVTRG